MTVEAKNSIAFASVTILKDFISLAAASKRLGIFSFSSSEHQRLHCAPNAVPVWTILEWKWTRASTEDVESGGKSMKPNKTPNDRKSVTLKVKLTNKVLFFTNKSNSLVKAFENP